MPYRTEGVAILLLVELYKEHTVLLSIDTSAKPPIIVIGVDSRYKEVATPEGPKLRMNYIRCKLEDRLSQYSVPKADISCIYISKLPDPKQYFQQLGLQGTQLAQAINMLNDN